MSTLMNDTERNECVALFKSGKSAKEIGLIYKRHPRTIEKLLSRRGVHKRSRPVPSVDTTQAPAE